MNLKGDLTLERVDDFLHRVEGLCAEGALGHYENVQLALDLLAAEHRCLAGVIRTIDLAIAGVVHAVVADLGFGVVGGADLEIEEALLLGGLQVTADPLVAGGLLHLVGEDERGQHCETVLLVDLLSGFVGPVVLLGIETGEESLQAADDRRGVALAVLAALVSEDDQLDLDRRRNLGADLGLLALGCVADRLHEVPLGATATVGLAVQMNRGATTGAGLDGLLERGLYQGLALVTLEAGRRCGDLLVGEARSLGALGPVAGQLPVVLVHAEEEIHPIVGRVLDHAGFDGVALDLVLAVHGGQVLALDLSDEIHLEVDRCAQLLERGDDPVHDLHAEGALGHDEKLQLRDATRR